jgi:hypothetical protein
MSEFQNKAVRLMEAGAGEASVSDVAERQRNLLASALELYRALGGSFELLEASIIQGETDTPRRVDLIIGDLMHELAAISHMHDMDIMQAAYNTLDMRLRMMAEDVV